MAFLSSGTFSLSFANTGEFSMAATSDSRAICSSFVRWDASFLDAPDTYAEKSRSWGVATSRNNVPSDAMPGLPARIISPGSEMRSCSPLIFVYFAAFSAYPSGYMALAKRSLRSPTSMLFRFRAALSPNFARTSARYAVSLFWSNFGMVPFRMELGNDGFGGTHLRSLSTFLPHCMTLGSFAFISASRSTPCVFPGGAVVAEFTAPVAAPSLALPESILSHVNRKCS